MKQITYHARYGGGGGYAGVLVEPLDDDELLESFDPLEDDELFESFDPLDDDELLESDDSAGGYCGARVGYGGG